MSDSISVEGTEYISSKRASQLSGYAQDYIGQLSRKGLIEAKRVGGLWYVSLDSLNGYKAKAEEYKPQPPSFVYQSTDPDSVLSFDGKQYVSAARAARDTGYHQDYVGQLARSGKILSRQVGNRWYVDREAVSSHKDEKDALLGAVQAQSVGITRAPASEHRETESDEPFFRYVNEDEKALMPIQGDKNADVPYQEPQKEDREYQIPIRVINAAPARRLQTPYIERERVVAPQSPKPHKFLAAAALTFVIVLSLGYVSLKSNALYALAPSRVEKSLSQLASAGAVGNVLSGFVQWAEAFLAPGVTYTKQ